MTKLQDVAVIHEHVGQSSLLGPPALTGGEDETAYHELFARVSATVKPRDFLEEIWLRDIVDLTWETLRMRRLKAPFISDISPFNIQYLATNINTVEPIDRMIMSAEARRNSALREIERHRADIAAALRRATDDIVDAEFEDVAHRPAQKDLA